ncbi:MAG: hypothetical protein AB7S81_03005 [Bdellovibrionales bacterium]
MTISDTLLELNSLCGFFLEADAELRDGKVTDVTGIDARVAAVCKKVTDALPEQQKEYLPLMNTLIALLNGYEKSLRTLQDSTMEPIIEEASKATKC